MKHVELYQLQNDGSQKTVGRFLLGEDGKIVGEGESPVIAEVLQNGYQGYGEQSGRLLTPNDGLLFLEQLCMHFKSAYLNASEVKEEKA